MREELWQICGRSPVLWTIPYCAIFDRHQQEVEIFPAIPLYKAWEVAANAVIAARARPYNGMWLIPEHELEAIGNRTPGGDPLCYFSWGQAREQDKPKYESLQAKRADRSEFLDALYQRGVGDSPEQLAYLWKEFMLHTADWLLNKEKPVDMIFAKLYNCPLRANWRSILLGRFPKLSWNLKNTGAKLREVLVRKGFMEDLLARDLIALNVNRGICLRRIEVEHTSLWWRLTTTQETDRLAKLGHYGYAQYFLDAMRRFIGPAIRLYSGWVAEIARPAVTDVPGGMAGEFRFTAFVPPGRVRPAPPVNPPVSVVVSNAKSGEHRSAKAKAVNGEPKDLPAEDVGDGGLPGLSDLQRLTQDLRNCRRAELPGSEYETEGYGRLSMFHAAEGAPSGQLLGVGEGP